MIDTKPKIPFFIEQEFKGEYDPIQVFCNLCDKTIFYSIGFSQAQYRASHHFKTVHNTVIIP